MEPARRHYGGEQHFHRTYSDQGALATHMDPHLDPRTFADYQIDNQQFSMNLNQLLAGVREEPLAAQLLHHLPHRSAPSYQLPSYSPYSSPFAPPAPPNSYRSPLLPQAPPEVRPAPSARAALFSSQYSAPSSQLGLEDIFERLDGLSRDLPSSSRQPTPPCAPALAPLPLLPQPSRDSPLSWNPLGPLSATTPLSLTPSPTLLPTLLPAPAPTVRPLMEQQVEGPYRPSSPPHPAPAPSEVSTAIRGIAKLQVTTKPSEGLGRSTSWSQIVRTSSSGRLCQSVSPPAAPRSASPGSPPPPPSAAAGLLPDYHRGPKVDPRWPVQQQVFLGPIPMSISWDEIRNVFYTKVTRKELLHFYVQSKPVNEVVYGQVVFDKVSLANKILKEGPVKVRGQYITLTAMGEKMKQMKMEKKK